MALVNGVLAVGTGFDGIGPTNGFVQIQTPTLGNTAGSAERASLLTGSSIGNTHYLYSGLHRNANGSTWESASFRLQHVVDSTAQQFLDFRGNAGATGSTVIGYGGSDFLTVSQSGKTTLVTPDTNKASLNLPPGAAPSSPVDGDVWRTSNGLFGRHGGVTVQYATGSGASLTGLMPTVEVDADTSPVLSAGNNYLLTRSNTGYTSEAVLFLPAAVVGSTIVVRQTNNTGGFVVLTGAGFIEQIRYGSATGGLTTRFVLAPGNMVALACYTAGIWELVAADLTSPWKTFSSNPTNQPITCGTFTAPVLAASVFSRTYWRRVGANIELEYVFKNQAGSGSTAGGGAYKFLTYMFSHDATSARAPFTDGLYNSGYSVLPNSGNGFQGVLGAVGYGCVEISPSNTTPAIAQWCYDSVSSSNLPGVVLFARVGAGDASGGLNTVVSNILYQLHSSFNTSYSIRATVAMRNW
jgi:hypothetical protein